MKMSTTLASLALLLVACNPMEQQAVLSAPSDVKVEQTGLETVRLTWTNSSTSYDGVIIERASQASGLQFAELTRTGKGVLIYNDKNHDGDASYRYRLTTYLGSDMSEPVVVDFLYSRLPAPTEIVCEKTSEGLVIAWKDNCTGEEGYIVRKKEGSGSFADWKVLPANSTTVTDPEVSSGSYDYELYAYIGEERSAAATIHYEDFSVPQITIGSKQASWYQVNIPFTLKDDGGYTCEGGICWKSDGTAGATVDDESYTFIGELHSGDRWFGNAVGLEYGKTYSFRPWVKYGDKIEYYTEVTAALAAEPVALEAEWTDISSQYSMPSSIKLYKTTTNVTGRTVNAWYAVADMSAGDLELRTFKTSSVMKPSVAATSGLVSGDVQIMVNGGFFGSGQSYSYVLNRGKEEASGVKSVTRKFYGDENKTSVSRSYNVTRGAFGVNAAGEPSVKWLYGSKEWAYEAPLPAYNSGPSMSPTSTFPAQRHSWDVYSAIGGGPVILHDGRLCFDYLVTKDKGNGGRYIGNPELLDDDIFGPSVRPPRTAIGHTADGKIVIMVVDGRNAGGSQGVSLDELARLMKGVGCTDVLNLDGGGSTVLCATPSAKILNVPSDGTERAVLSFVAIVKK